MGHRHGRCDYGRVSVEDPSKECGSGVHQDSYSHGDGDREYHCIAYAFFDALTVVGTKVLAHEGRYRSAERCGRKRCELVDSLANSRSCYDRGVKAVDVAPHKQIRERNNGTLDSCGKTYIQGLCNHRAPVSERFRYGKASDLHPACNDVPAYGNGDHLCDYRCNGNSRNAPLEDGAEDKVQHYVQRAGDKQDHEWRLHVAHAAQYACGIVVDYGEDHAGDVDAKVCKGMGIDFVADLDQVQQKRGDQKTYDRERQAKKDSEGVCVSDALVQLGLVASAEGLGNHYRASD